MGGYVSPGMSPRRAMTISDLLLRRGDIAARSAAQSGQMWGNTLAGVGQAIGGALEQRQEQKEFDKRSQALTELASSDIWGQDPQAGMAAAVKVLGPQEGVKFAQGIMATAEVAQQPDPGVAQKNLPVIARGWMAASPGARSQLWNPLRETLINAKLGTEQDWPAEWSEEFAPQVKALAEQYMPEEKPPPPTPEEEADAAALKRRKILEVEQEFAPPEPPAAGAGAAENPDVAFLGSGGTLSDIKQADRTKVAQQAAAQGIPVFRDQKQKESYQNIEVMTQDVDELMGLLDDKEVLEYMGPLMGTLTTAATSGGLTEAIATFGGLRSIPEKVRRAASLMFNLSDKRVRERSGAQVNEKELDRIMRFTVNPNLSVPQLVSNLKNLRREARTIKKGYAPIGSPEGPPPELPPAPAAPKMSTRAQSAYDRLKEAGGY